MKTTFLVTSNTSTKGTKAILLLYGINLLLLPKKWCRNHKDQNTIISQLLKKAKCVQGKEASASSQLPLLFPECEESQNL